MEIDRSILINLARRPERLAGTFAELAREGWPFPPLTRLDAIDGARLPAPHAWRGGPGAWGCMLSHRRALEAAIIDGIRGGVLIVEDDLALAPGFAERARAFMASVPGDWEGLMLGGEHQAPPVRLYDHGGRAEIPAGVVRCRKTSRTHCYAVRGRYLHELYRQLMSTATHCDHGMADIQWRFKVYAPDPFLAGQRGGRSEITGRMEPPRSWPTATATPGPAAPPMPPPIHA